MRKTVVSVGGGESEKGVSSRRGTPCMLLLMNFWRVLRLNRDQIVLAHVDALAGV